jgi:carboxyl-terminal processing protease
MTRPAFRLRLSSLAALAGVLGSIAFAIGSGRVSAAQSQSVPGSGWALGGGAAGATMKTAGSPLESAGAALTLTAPAALAVATTSMRVPADAYRGRRLTLSAELGTKDVGAGASLWIRVDAGTQMLILDNGTADALSGTKDWTRRRVAAVVPNEATTIVVGLLLRGGGTMTARGVRLETIDPGSAPMSETAKTMIDTAIRLTKEKALKAPDVNWPSVEPMVRLSAAGATTAADTYPAIRYLLGALGDHHSFLMPPSATSDFKSGAVQNPPPDVRAMPDKTGYISVPAYSGGEAASMKAYAVRAHELLVAAAPNVSCGWVVDLRSNGGGNMWPMLAGLKPFLGGSGLGSFEGRDGNGPKWIAGQGIGAEPPASLNALENSWVAVLTGPRTASSGEAVTIAFRGRPRTRSFGQGTAGLSTSNQNVPLPDGSMMLLTTAIELDRDGNKYGGVIQPDVNIAAAPAGTPTDPVLSAATTWLRASTRCEFRQLTHNR